MTMKSTFRGLTLALLAMAFTAPVCDVTAQVHAPTFSLSDGTEILPGKQVGLRTPHFGPVSALATGGDLILSATAARIERQESMAGHSPVDIDVQTTSGATVALFARVDGVIVPLGLHVADAHGVIELHLLVPNRVLAPLKRLGAVAVTLDTGAPADTPAGPSATL